MTKTLANETYDGYRIVVHEGLSPEDMRDVEIFRVNGKLLYSFVVGNATPIEEALAMGRRWVDIKTGRFVDPQTENARLTARVAELEVACQAALWRLEVYDYQAMQPTIKKLRDVLEAK